MAGRAIALTKNETGYTLHVNARTRIGGAVILLAILFPATARAQECRVTPRAIPQGDTLRMQCSRAVTSARMSERTVRVFPEADGEWFGLMPVAVNDNPGATQIEFLDADQNVVTKIQVEIRSKRFPTQNVTLSPAIEGLHTSSDEMQVLHGFRDSVSDIRYWQDPLVAPVPGCLLSPFGVKRLHNGQPTGEYHGGVDLRAPAGHPIRAAADGVVRIAQPFNVLGGTVGLDHGQGLETM
jgi:murein DD-endopeptidase MepM/ murein hydrolase activator NlpD